MKICFVLDLIPARPMGGVKIIFKYANHFAQSGCEVRIAFTSSFLGSLKKYIPYKIRKRMVSLYLIKGPSWFKLDRRIRRICIDKIDNDNIPDGDIIFATAVTTAEAVANLSYKKGKKFYLIQGYENWAKGDQYVKKTYNLGMHNITISDWLYNIVYKESGIKPTLIKNPIDTKIIKLIIDPAVRNAHSIAMICQNDEQKGFIYGLQAICKIKEMFPDTECTIFGISKRRSDIPAWIKYRRNVKERELVKIYNESAVFLCSSISEGYGLCGAESMACGCALVSTDYEGVHSYADNNINALLSPVKDVDALVKNIMKLFNDTDFRVLLASRGNKDIQKLSWEKAFILLDEMIDENIKDSPQSKHK